MSGRRRARKSTHRGPGFTTSTRTGVSRPLPKGASKEKLNPCPDRQRVARPPSTLFPTGVFRLPSLVRLGPAYLREPSSAQSDPVRETNRQSQTRRSSGPSSARGCSSVMRLSMTAASVSGTACPVPCSSSPAECCRWTFRPRVNRRGYREEGMCLRWIRRLRILRVDNVLPCRQPPRGKQDPPPSGCAQVHRLSKTG